MGKECSSSDDLFKSVEILLQNFAAVNKRLYLKFVHAFHVKENSDFELVGQCKTISDILEATKHQTDNFTPLEVAKLFPLPCKISNYGLLLLAKLIVKGDNKVRHVCLRLDYQSCELLYENLGDGDILPDFRVRTKAGLIEVGGPKEEESSDYKSRWYEVLQSKLRKWADSSSPVNSNKVPSLQLVDVEDYNLLYDSLKKRHGPYLIKNWSECTDPQKYVYEDIAISAYLILLWKRVGVPKGFVDLGCGNGLLVYILNSEGFVGYGVDVRRRRIWDAYPKFVKLLEETLNPSEFPKFANSDWILGNHSDELSPWIPVLAAANSYETNYFLLPCCAYEFNGDKYQRRNAKESVYNDFLDYVGVISYQCGFIFQKDRLKIPSTKRIAYVAVERNYPLEEFNAKGSLLRASIDEQIGSKQVKLREKSQSVRNCTQIEKSILEKIVKRVFDLILERGENVSIEYSGWRKGGSLSLKELAQCLPSGDLANIKSECGGLKTLLKNRHEIFEICGENVQIRYPRKISEITAKKPLTLKKRSCFFYTHHPEGCPLTNESCSFIHGE